MLTFHEMISEKWIMPVEDNAPEDVCCWYLPFLLLIRISQESFLTGPLRLGVHLLTMLSSRVQIYLMV